MADLEFRRWTEPPRTILEDLCGCHDDMLFVADVTEKLLVQYDQDQPDHTLVDALSVAAIVRYCRSFVQGYRFRLDPGTQAELNEDELVLHNRIRQTRDKHIAHPINLQETYTLTIGFAAEGPSAFAPQAIGVQGRQIAAVDAADADRLNALAHRWLEWIQAAMNEEQLRLMPTAMQLTPDQVQSLPQPPDSPSQDPGTRRRQPR